MAPCGGGWKVTHPCSPESGPLTGMIPEGRQGPKHRLLHWASPRGWSGLPSTWQPRGVRSLQDGSGLQEPVFRDAWPEALRLFVTQPWRWQSIISAISLFVKQAATALPRSKGRGVQLHLSVGKSAKHLHSSLTYHNIHSAKYTVLTSNAGSENSVNPNNNSQSVTVCLIQLNDARRRRDSFLSDVSFAD